MGKLPSAETQLRHAKTERKAIFERLSKVEDERDHFRTRATKAEQEVAEWKRRFDALLARTPELPT